MERPFLCQFLSLDFGLHLKFAFQDVPEHLWPGANGNVNLHLGKLGRDNKVGKSDSLLVR